LRALIFDSWFDAYRGVIILARIMDGKIAIGQKIKLWSNGEQFEVEGLGYQSPKAIPLPELVAGEVGFIYANIKNVADAKIGDTITDAANPAAEPLPGFEEIKPMVFAGLYPVESHEHGALRDALEKLRLNDSAFSFEPENSVALGFGFRCGFLGLLHMEIVQERLEREFNIELVQTAPNVTYEIEQNDGTMTLITSPSKAPDPSKIKAYREPMAKVQFIVPIEFIGVVIKLAEDRRGTFIKQDYIGSKRCILDYELPLAEIVFDFYDKLKSATKGYGTMDYHLIGFKEASLAKVDILVHGTPVDALSMICHRETAEARARRVLVKLRKQIPKHLFVIALQAAIGGKIIARESISATAKNVTAKCYGGDITRKRKLLEKQKEGKKKMRSRNIGSVEVPQDAFLAVLDTRDDDED